MALSVDKSMDIADFWLCWEHVAALVEAEYKAVEGSDGSYELHLELIWDCEDDEEEPEGGGMRDGDWL